MSCRAAGEGAELRVGALLEAGSVSRDHVWFPSLLEALIGLGRLLELLLDKPWGLGGPLGPSEVPAAAEQEGDMVLRKLVL